MAGPGSEVQQVDCQVVHAFVHAWEGMWNEKRMKAGFGEAGWKDGKTIVCFGTSGAVRWILCGIAEFGRSREGLGVGGLGLWCDGRVVL